MYMDVVELQGRKYVKASKVAKDNGYTSDYVGQLCRAGLVRAERIGRSWYVDAEDVIKHRGEKKRNTKNKTRLLAASLRNAPQMRMGTSLKGAGYDSGTQYDVQNEPDFSFENIARRPVIKKVKSALHDESTWSHDSKDTREDIESRNAEAEEYDEYESVRSGLEEFLSDSAESRVTASDDLDEFDFNVFSYDDEEASQQIKGEHIGTENEEEETTDDSPYLEEDDSKSEDDDVSTHFIVAQIQAEKMQSVSRVEIPVRIKEGRPASRPAKFIEQNDSVERENVSLHGRVTVDELVSYTQHSERGIWVWVMCMLFIPAIVFLGGIYTEKGNITVRKAEKQLVYSGFSIQNH